MELCFWVVKGKDFLLMSHLPLEATLLEAVIDRKPETIHIKMSQETSEPLTRRRFLESTCLMLKMILQPEIISSALLEIATKLNIPDAPSFVAGLVGPIKRKITKEGKQPKINQFFSAWFSDFSSNYDRHPVVSRLKAENPGVKLSSLSYVYLKTLPLLRKVWICDVVFISPGEVKSLGVMAAAAFTYASRMCGIYNM